MARSPNTPSTLTIRKPIRQHSLTPPTPENTTLLGKMAAVPAADAPLECVLCLEVITGDSVLIDSTEPDFPVCQKCARDDIVPVLIQASQFEVMYPPMCGNLRIDWRNFIQFLPHGFQENYAKKQLEFDCPVQLRVYCSQCKEVFLGKQTTSSKMQYECECNSEKVTCANCSDGFIKGERHKCKAKEKSDAEIATEGLVRGKDYQICPGENCGRVIQLAEACNHITCPCGESFCFLCSLPVKGDSDHWARTCPRYGHPDNPRGALFDDPADFQEPAGESADEEAHREHTEDLLPVPLPEGFDVALAIVLWRNYPTNFSLVLDESYLNDLFRQVFHVEQPRFGDVDDLTLSMLLQHLRFSIPDIALWSVIGHALDQARANMLLARYIHLRRDMLELWDATDGTMWQRFPRAARVYQRIANRLEQVITDITALGREDEVALPMRFRREQIPVVSQELLAELDGARLEFLRQRDVDADGQEHIDTSALLFMLMTDNLRKPELFVNNPGQGWALMASFMDQHELLGPLFDGLRDLVQVDAQHALLMEQYNLAARAFLQIFPEGVLRRYRRGWHPRQQQ
ncbi:hypothetical protein Q7P37_004322 [Cladosporium fusiforme]